MSPAWTISSEADAGRWWGSRGIPTSTATSFTERLKARGEEVFAVNPNVDEVDGEPCYASLADLPEAVDQIVIVIPPDETAQVVEEAAEQGVHRVWMQPGAESSAAVDFCKEQGMNVVAGRCILRYMDYIDARSEDR